MPKPFPKKHFEDFLDSKITMTTYMDPGYANTNDVWLVETEQDSYAIKLSGHTKRKPAGCFWYGLNYLFGSNPGHEFKNIPEFTRKLNKLGNIYVPEIYYLVLKDKKIKQPFLVQERLYGETYTYQNSKKFHKNSKLVEQFGYHVACLHSRKYRTFGSLDGRIKRPGKDFNKRLKATLKILYRKFHSKDKLVGKLLPEYLKKIDKLPNPKYFSLIMLDNGAAQYLTKDNKIIGLIDIESFIIGPPEMELAALELDMRQFKAFKKGYKKKLGKVPEIGQFRDVYRFFFYLFYGAPPRELDKWLELPVVLE